MKFYAPSIFILLGLHFIIGTKCNLRSLVDPSEKWYSGNSATFIKKHFGKEGLIFINYLFGILSLIIGFIIAYKNFWAK